MVEGDIELIRADGASFRSLKEKIWLCRCAKSANKPYCDGAHSRAGFNDSAQVSASYVIKKPEAGTSGTVLRLMPRTNGPVHCLGDMKIVGNDGSEWAGNQANLCRCGRSANKPFCDGSHRQSGFIAD
ncbi:MAG: hypothetical protein GTO41_17515 [Burkholderiales bacterium]|nr:hypothetical protein [Burkholderiales bacterium]